MTKNTRMDVHSKILRTIRALYFQRDLESVSYINTVTEHYWLIHAAETVK